MRLPVLLLLAVMSPAGLSQPAHADSADMPAPAPWAAAAGTELPASALLAIGILPLDDGVPPDNANDPAYALRDAESRYFAYHLRRVLDEQARWGPVRVLPRASHAVELTVSGTIHHSSGERLALDIQAVDGSGRRWIDRRYEMSVDGADYGDRGAEPFQAVYQAVADDLDQFRLSLPLNELEHLLELSQLRYAAALAPSAFDGYLAESDGGRINALRLPSREDPVLTRVLRIREAEYLFADTVDLQFEQYYQELKPTYLAWRQATVEAGGLMAAYREQASRRKNKSAQQKYNELRELKLYQQTLRDNLAAFAFEVSPSTLEVAGQVVQLSGSLLEQQAQWQDLLERLYVQEVGVLPAGG